MIIDKGIAAKKAKKILFFISMVYFGLLGQHGYKQAEVWSSNNSILINAYANNPESIGANLEIVSELAGQNDLLSSLSINSDIIAARPVDSLPAKIQIFFIYCELANDIPSEEYEILEKDLNLKNRLLISTALENFVQSYNYRQCDFIDLRQIIDSFISWSDQLIILRGKDSLRTMEYRFLHD